MDTHASAAPSKPAPRSTPRNTNPLSPTKKRILEKRILNLQLDVKNNWKVGGFCSTYGHSVRAGHDSGNCAEKKDVGKASGQNVNATSANPVGTGMDFNKGWDAWSL